jgi:hypothetical protein
VRRRGVAHLHGPEQRDELQTCDVLEICVVSDERYPKMNRLCANPRITPVKGATRSPALYGGTRIRFLHA